MQYIYYICGMTNIRLKLARVENGLSQQELAERVEVTRQTIGLIEKGRYNPTIKRWMIYFGKIVQFNNINFRKWLKEQDFLIWMREVNR